jgi:hypothetical protein
LGSAVAAGSVGIGSWAIESVDRPSAAVTTTSVVRMEIDLAVAWLAT